MPCELRIVIYLVFLVALFFIETPACYGVFAVILLVLLRRIPMKVLTRGSAVILIFLLFTFLSNLFFRQGKVIFAAGPVIITADGLTDASVKTMRIFFMIAGARLLAASANAGALLRAFGRILKPLQHVGFPVNSYLSTMSLTLESLPHVRDECLRLYGEKVRGQNIDGFRNRVKVAAGLLVVLFRESLENPERYLGRTKPDVHEIPGIR